MPSRSEGDPGKVKEKPASIVDQQTHQEYRIGKLLGEGGFGRCYRVTEVSSNEKFACKVTRKPRHVERKLPREIAIHRGLNHQNVVKFYRFFTDACNMYMLLELCPRRSLHSFQKHRKTFSEDETRHFIKQIVSGCKYLHEIRVVHRDLKPDNILLTEDLQVKIGDFGLATTQRFDGERIKGRCGTTNYMAPEVVADKLYGQEVDVWSVGCMAYTLLVGQPPFKTSSKEKTIARIKKNKYKIPPGIGPAARKMMKSLLKGNPKKRPTMAEILDHKFLTTEYLPSCPTLEQKDDDEPEVCHETYVMTPLPLVVQTEAHQLIDGDAEELYAEWMRRFAEHGLTEFNSTEPSPTSDGLNNKPCAGKNDVEHGHSSQPVPANLTAKRVTPLKSFRNFISERLLQIRKLCRNIFDRRTKAEPTNEIV